MPVSVIVAHATAESLFAALCRAYGHDGECAELLEVHRGTIQRWRTGQTDAPYWAVIVLADQLRQRGFAVHLGSAGAPDDGGEA